MANQEISAPMTRLAMKRAAQAMGGSESQKKEPATKKRVVLGEISNLGNVVQTKEKPKCLPDKKLKKGGKEILGFDFDKKSNDPQMCVDDVSDIYGYLHKMELETKRRPVSDYVEKVQKYVTANMRGVLVDWLVEVSMEYKLLPDTLYLAVSYIDRYLSVNAISRQKLQLLGVSSVLIASKYEEITPKNVSDFCDITDNTYKKEDIVKMEADLLKTLRFEMGNPTVHTFLGRCLRVVQENNAVPKLKFEFLASYLGELSLLDYGCIKFLPSLIAASVTFLANFTVRLNVHPWSSGLKRCTGYKPEDLKECVLMLHDLQLGKRGSSLTAVRDKYKRCKFKCVSTLYPPEIPVSFFNDV